MAKIYYVYLHINLVSNEVFYVGKGKGKRAWDKVGRSDYWKRITNKYGYSVEIIENNLTNEESKIREIYYINKLGRKDLGLGTLVNFTDGGEGVSGFKFSEETLKKMSEIKIGKIGNRKGKIASEETRRKLSEAHKGKPSHKKGISMSEEQKEKLRKPKSDETRRKMSESKKGKTAHNKGKSHTEEYKKRMSEIHKLRWDLKKLLINEDGKY